jgi:hypothetical protein
MYTKDDLLTMKNNSNINQFTIDNTGNINLNDYMYSATGNLVFKNTNFNTDPIIDASGNIITNEYLYDLSNNSFKTNNNLLSIDNNSTMCNNFQFDKSNDIINFKLNDVQLSLNNNGISDSNKLFNINNNIINMNSNKYKYDMMSNNFNGIMTDTNNFNLLNDGLNIIKNGKPTSLYNYDGKGSIIYSVSSIVIEKILTSANWDKPLHISSIRFYDVNNNTITPDKYTLDRYGSSIQDGMYNTRYDVSSNSYYVYDPSKNTFAAYNATLYPYLKYFDISKLTEPMTGVYYSYGGPKVDTYSLFWNRTVSFDNNKPIISDNSKQQILNQSHNFVGQGSNQLPMVRQDPSTINKFPGYNVTHFYRFNFTNPILIKYIEIENRKDGNFDRINNAYIYSYINNNDEKTLINITKCSESSLVPDANIISTPEKTLLQPKNRLEKFNAIDYGATQLPTNYDPIVRYYIQ